MTPQEAIQTIKIAIAEIEWDYPMDYAIAFEEAIEALEKQHSIVHCKDCQNWKTITIETIDGRTAEAGQCELTKWLCGEQGYCMYGREVE